jgi:hypothetical protein
VQRRRQHLGRRTRHADVYRGGAGPAGERQAEDGRHEQRRCQAADEDGAIAQPAVELVPRDDADQSRSSFPVRLKKTSSRFGVRTSTPVRSTPCFGRHGDHRGEDGRSVVGGQLQAALVLVDVVDVAELEAGGGELSERGPVTGQVHLVPAAVRADERLGRPLGNELAVVNDADAVAQPGRLFHVMGRVEDGDAQPADGLENGVAALRVDPDRGLVEHQQLGPVQQARRHVGPPLHAARVGPDAVLAPVRQPHQLQRLADASLQLLAAQPVELAEEGQVLDGGEVGVQRQVLGDVADRRLGLQGPADEAVDGDLSLVGDGEAAQHGDGRGLPGAVGPEQPVALARRNGEGHALDRLAVAVALAQALTAQHCLLHAPSPGKRGPSFFAP